MICDNLVWGNGRFPFKSPAKQALSPNLSNNNYQLVSSICKRQRAVDSKKLDFKPKRGIIKALNLATILLQHL
jgi:hypothetical protein